MNKALLALLIGMVPAMAQTTSLNGVVTDPAGASIPEATITITNQSTSASRSAVSDATGAYTFQQLPPDMYIVEAQRPGFSTYRTAEAIRLQTNTPATLNIQMTLGQVSQTIDVVGEATAINTENAAIGNPFTQNQIRQLPLLTRNVVQLLSLQPGVTDTGYVLGARPDQNNVTLDGIDVNDNQSSTGFEAALPVPLDSVQEFRTTVAGQQANQGRSSGGQVSLVTKSGSNAWHGSLYEFHRNKSTAANTWFNNRAGIPRENLIRNQFGWSVGGPVVHDRAFFFFNMEERKDRTAVSTTRNVPSASFRQGIVKFAMSNGQIGQLTPAEVIAADPLHLGTNSAVMGLLNSLPLGNDPVSSADGGLNVDILRFNAPKTLNNRALVGKMDFNLDKAAMNVLSVRGTLAANKQDQTLAQFPGQSAASQMVDNSRGLSSTYTSVISPQMVNKLSFGLTRIGNAQTGTTASQLSLYFDTPTAFPRPSTRIAPTYNITDDLTYNAGRHTWQFGINFRLVRNSRTSYSNFPTYRFSRNTLKGLGADIYSAVSGLAQSKYGDVSLTQKTNVENAMGAMLGLLNNYNATYQFNVSGSATPFGGAIPRAFSTNEYDFYFMDTFKLRRDLTVTYGLRYSNFSPVYESNGQQILPSVSLDQYFADRNGGSRNGEPGFALPTADLTYVLGGPANNAKNWYKRDNNNFAPRLSIAYAPDLDGTLGKLWGHGAVLRAGAGVTYDRYGSNMAVNFASSGSPGLTTVVTQPLNTDFTDTYRYTGVTPPAYAPAPQGGGFPFTPPQTFGGFNSYSGVSPGLVAPYQYLLNFSYTRPLPKGMSIEIGYIGRLSHKNLLRKDYSQPLTQFTDPKSGLSWTQMAGQMRDLYESGITPAQVKADPSLIPLNPFVEDIFPAAKNDRINGSASANYFYTTYQTYASSDLDALHDYDRVQRSNGQCISVYGCHTFFATQSAGLLAWTNEGRAAYNGMQIVLRRPLKDGWGFDFNYTWSHAIDNASASESAAASVQDAFNPNGFRGPSDFDMRHLITANTVIELPFGNNKRFASHLNPIVDGFVGGWQITALIQFHTGTPLNLTNGGAYPTNYLNSALAQLRPGFTMPAVGITSNQKGNPSLFANTTDYMAFMGQYPGTTGTRGLIRGPRFRNIDLSIGKYFHMPWEGHTLQIRAEAFNAFNFVNYTISNSNLSITSQGTFGQFTGTQPPRVMQFAMRYEF